MEFIQKNILETIMALGDNSISFCFEATGELGKNLILFLLNSLGEKNLEDIRNDTLKCSEVQQTLLQSILASQQYTEYGKKYHFKNIQTIEEFRSRHPITTYKDYQLLINNIYETGDYTQLLTEPITLFQETSGTTGAIKLIPRTSSLSQSFLKVSQASESFADFYFLKPNSIFKNYRGLALVNTLPVKKSPTGIPQGTGTSVGLRQYLEKYQLIKKILSFKFSSPPSIFLIDDYESAYYCHLLFGLLDKDLTFIAANFAANVWEAIQILEKKWQQLIKDVQLGYISEELKLEKNIRSELQSLLKANPSRAKELQNEFEQGFNKILPRIWTRLSYIQCITTGSMSLYKENLSFYAGEIPFYSGTYGASEAWIGININPQREPCAYVITPHSAFFEFIPEIEIDAETPSTVTLAELIIGEKYEVVVTTVAGLYRYRLGDVIKCVDYYNQSPVVEFLYRRNSLLNLAGEKVSENVIWMALSEATEKIMIGCKIIDYTTCVKIDFTSRRYVVYIELTNSMEVLSELDSYSDRVEENLTKFNDLYKTLREANLIEKIKIN
ncbi:hypothetical protein C7B79_01920, partial [Chroococcidiopsis cubana CCALA 043]